MRIRVGHGHSWGRSALLLILTLVAGALISCGGGDSSNAAETILRGSVSAGSPVTNAKLAVHDTTGKLIYQSDKPVTGDYGAFIVGIKGLPSDFRVVVSGGDLSGEAFPAKLAADSRNFKANTGIAINLVTTMVSAYLDKNPGKTLEEATTAVRNYLGIPQSVDIGSLQLDPYFGSNAFLAEADTNGGVSNYVSLLVAEVDGGARRQFADPPILKGAGLWIAEKLAAGAVGYVAGAGLGWALDQAGMGDDGKRQTLEMLAQISQQLTQLQNQMTAMQQQLNAVDYNVIVASLGTLPSDIQTLHKDLHIYVSITPTEENKGSLADEKARIQGQIANYIMPRENAISNAMLGSGYAGGGLIEKWSRVVAGRHHFFSWADSQAQIDMFNYWDYLQQVQLELIVEYRHATKADAAFVTAHIDNYRKINNPAQVAKAPKPLQFGRTMVVSPMAPGDSGEGIMIYPINQSSPMSLAEANQKVSELNSDKVGGWSNWQLPSFSSSQSAEIRALFQNPYPSVRLKDWALSQGWIPELWPRWPDPYDASYWLDDGAIWGDTIYRFGEYDGRGGYYWRIKIDASFVLAVRYLAPGEVYFYK